MADRSFLGDSGFDANNQKITNLAAPTVDSDAATRAFSRNASNLNTGTAAATVGGTGITSYAVGDLLYASSTTALSKLAGVATGNALISGGANTAPAWGKVGLTTHISGTLAAANGGTGFASYAVGDILYASTTTALSKLAGVATGNVLISGGVSTAPSWGKVGLTTHISGTLAAANGGTGFASYTIGDILYASTASALSALAGVATGNVLISGGVGAAPSWGKVGLTTHISGTLALGNGGTGATTQAGAANAILPSQTSQSGKFLTTDGTNVSWATVSGGGTTTNALTFNNAGSGAASGSTFNGSAAVTISHNTIGAPARASFPANNESTLDAADLRTITNPTTGLGYAGGMRVRFSSLNDDNASPYADVIDLSTYTDSSGGGFNALYLGKNSQVIRHKYAAAAGTSWTTKTLAYTDSNITGTAANVTGTVAVANGGTGATAAAGARTNLGATTVGANLFTLANPSAITFLRVNADNTVSTLDASTFRTAIGAGTSSATGTVTSVGGTGTVSGLTLSGTVTTTGNLTLGGTLSVTASNFASQTANTFLAAPNGAAGVPTFRAIVAADIPTLNQSTTGSAATLTTTRTIWGQNFNGSANVSGALSGATTIDASGNITTSAGKLRSGAGATGGAVMLEGNYSNGTLNTVGSMFSSAATMIGFAVTPSTVANNAFLSATGIAIARSAMLLDGAEMRFYLGATQTVTVGSAVTMTQYMQLTTSGLSVTGTVTASSTMTATNFLLSSDARFKTNLTPITHALAALDTLTAYRYLHLRNKQQEVGVLAQEVREVLPEAVCEDDEGMLSVAYDRLVPLLLAAVKELSAQVKQLQSEA